MMDFNAEAMFLAVTVRRGTASGYLEPRSINVSTNLILFLDHREGTNNIKRLSNGLEIDVQ